MEETREKRIVEKGTRRNGTVTSNMGKWGRIEGERTKEEEDIKNIVTNP